MWTAGRVAQFLGYSYDHFRKHVRYWDGVPQPVNTPGRDRWLSDEWIEWAKTNKRAA